MDCISKEVSGIKKWGIPKDDYFDEQDNKFYKNLKLHISEIRSFNQDFEYLRSLTGKPRDNFINENIEMLSEFLNDSSRILFKNPEINSTYLKYGTLCLFYEYLIQFCNLKANWDESFNNFASKNKGGRFDKRNFEIRKQLLFQDLFSKLTKCQFERAKDILYYVQTQRNNFLHGSLKAFDDGVTFNECLLFIVVLNKLYELNLDNLVMGRIIEIIKKQNKDSIVNKGMLYKSVGFLELITGKE